MTRTILLTAAALVCAFSLGVPPVQAQPERQVVVTGAAACDGVTGERVITWTATNNTGVDVSVVLVDVLFAPGAGPATVATTPFAPDPVSALGGTATATTRFDGAWLGNVGLQVDLIPSVAEFQSAVPVFQPCLQPTTTTAPTTTTTLPTTTTTARPVRVLPTFTG